MFNKVMGLEIEQGINNYSAYKLYIDILAFLMLVHLLLYDKEKVSKSKHQR
jgi:hypothetical protein